jgi:UDP-glucose 4-epimerase
MSSRVLITGCAGFIGSRLAKRINGAGFEVVASARSPSPELARELGMPVMALDVLHAPDDVPQVEVIIHCATANDILSRDFEAGLALSVCGTRNVLELARRRGVTRVIFLSTLQVYGTELAGEITEATPPCCESAYALNHFFGEELCRMYARNHGLDIAVLRPANVYGVPDVSSVKRTTLVPMCFVEEALNSGAVTLRSSGRQRRNFVSTDAVADVCLRLLEDFPQGLQVVNVASDWLCSVREIAEMTCEVYREKYGKPLPLSILSQEPQQGGHFAVGSRFSGLRCTIEESRSTMRGAISGLFDNLPKGQP